MAAGEESNVRKISDMFEATAQQNLLEAPAPNKQLNSPRPERGARAKHRATIQAELGGVFFSGEEAVKEVAKPDGSWNWVLVGPDKNLPLSSGGSGGAEEMRENLGKHAHCFGVLRMTFGSQREAVVKWLFIHASDDHNPKFTAVQRGREMMKEREIHAKIAQLAQISCDAVITSTADCTVEFMMSALQKVVTGFDGGKVTLENYELAEEEYADTHRGRLGDAITRLETVKMVMQEVAPPAAQAVEAEEDEEEEEEEEPPTAAQVVEAAPKEEGEQPAVEAVEAAAKEEAQVVEAAPKKEAEPPAVPVAEAASKEEAEPPAEQATEAAAKKEAEPAAALPAEATAKEEAEPPAEQATEAAAKEEAEPPGAQAVEAAAKEEPLAAQAVEAAAKEEAEPPAAAKVAIPEGRNPPEAVEAVAEQAIPVTEVIPQAEALPQEVNSQQVPQVAVPARKTYLKGDQVEIYSASQGKWILDAEVVDIVNKDSVVNGVSVRGGSMKVVYELGKRFKWVAPQQMGEMIRLSPRPRPPNPKVGELEHESFSWWSSTWISVYVELNKGFLQWWPNKDAASKGKAPNKSIYLLGLQQGHSLGAAHFQVRSDATRGSIFNFRCAGGDIADTWATDLWGHAEFCQETAEFYEAKMGGVRVRSQLLKVMDARHKQRINIAADDGAKTAESPPEVQDLHHFLNTG